MSFINNFEYLTTKNFKINAWRIPITGGISGNFMYKNGFLLGDVAGFVDPFLGEGISYAIQSGKIAAECIIKKETENYNKIVEKEIIDNLKYARILMKIITSIQKDLLNF